MYPTEEEIKHIMELTGMEFIQARNHLVQQKELAYAAARQELLPINLIE